MRAASLALLLLTLALPAAAQKKDAKSDAPRVRYAVPLAVPAGQKVKVTLRGQKLDAVTEVMATDAKVSTKLVGKGKKATVPNNSPADLVGDTEAEAEVELPKGYAADAVELTVVTPTGPATYRLTVARDSVPEQEPNDGFAKPQEVSLPATVDGTLGREKDVDVFRIAGKAGQAVRVEVVASRLGSPADVFVTLYDANRQVVQSGDDAADGTPDPAFTATLPRDGTYYLGVIEAHDLGGPMFGYRLQIGP